MALELSEKEQIQMPSFSLEMLSFFNERLIVVLAAMNSSRLIEKIPCRWLGSRYLQAKPSEVKPPRPNSDASEIANDDGRQKVIWSICIPLFLV